MTAAPQASPAARTRRRVFRALGIYFLVGISAGLYSMWSTASLQHAGRLLHQLSHGDREARKQAAWALADASHRVYCRNLTVRLDPNAEPDADVREAVVYALGRFADPNSAADVAETVQHDPSGYVRQAAWLALARIDGAAFRALAAREDPAQGVGSAAATAPNGAPRAWTELGIVQGRMELGDFGDAPRLLALACDAPEDVRLVARRAVARRIAPLLEVSGRWPLTVNAATPEAWSSADLALVNARCQGRDLGVVSAQTRPFAAQAVALRYNLGKLLKTRQRVAQVLFGP